MEKMYSIGIDYGTESGRVLLVDIGNGEVIAEHVTGYPYGVMDERLPHSGKILEPDWALQHPDDYMEVLRRSVPEVLRLAGIDAGQVIGIGIDFTACTVLPVDESGVPLCELEELRDEPHAYVKLWKHHAAQDEANRINQIAERRGERFLSRYGGKTSSEWMAAKAWQLLNEAPALYERTHRFMEAVDWVVLQMTDSSARNSCCAGYKAFWHKEEGYPSASFFRELDPRLEHLVKDKLQGDVVSLGAKAGELTEKAAAMMGLRAGTAVAAGIIDAHSGVPGTGAVQSGQMVMAMGTSLCHMLLSDKEIHVEGICGVVEDGIIPGLFGYEAGQPAVGDIFAWFVEQGVPAYVEQAAEDDGISVHGWLERQACELRPGQHGLLALDWWNGNRTVLVDADLSGMIVGLTLQTKPEEIYRCLLEATAFGTRTIIENFEQAGLAIHELFACGGLPQRNELLMQIYADVTRREIKIAESTQTPALGAAMFGAVAAGKERGGYSSIEEAAARMARVREQMYKPIEANSIVYDQLYAEYCRLHELFGRGGSAVMKQLKRIRLQQEERSAAL
ncbi:ribulokinase [Paenibacillus alkaliterrae]|uniref:ribulokinase n=1 Tax=Paenibacillus alkaliterrae TaxID=320909 RepID=UPI001F188B59|nr:ribulokinase [Paenibacillus alkaliterrae]MCF2940082.1 ribulokinase [Paenibacillus alkaliterrae]